MTLTQKLAAMSDRQLKHAYAIGDYWNVCEEAESRIRELEAALREAMEWDWMTDAELIPADVRSRLEGLTGMETKGDAT